MEPLDTLGKRLAQARRQLAVVEGRDISPPDMARRVGVSVPTYWRWERDERTPTTPALRTVARELGVTMDWLLDYKAEGTPPAPVPNRKEERDERGSVPLDQPTDYTPSPKPSEQRTPGRKTGSDGKKRR